MRQAGIKPIWIIEKKWRYLLLLLLFLLPQMLAAQNRKLERIHAFKVAFITEKVALTPAQSKDFWPLYDEYEKSLRSLRRQYMDRYRRGLNESTADEVQTYVDDNLDYQEAVIELKRNYKDRMLKIISPQQLADLYRAEHAFRQLLIQKLRERRGGRR